MAQTKVKLVSNGVITVDNLHTNHGITTDHIGEGSVLYYTDARVQSFLTSNNYITTTDVASLETLTSLSLAANILTYTDEVGNTTNLDLSLYLDDTNLARLVSGTLDGGTGIATFTRDDSSTFTVDFSAFLSDANDYVSSASFNTSDGVLTLTRFGGGTVTVDLDGKYAELVHTHVWTDITDRPTALSSFTNDLGNYGGFLTSFTETDPVFTASAASGITSTNISNWNTAYGWGNHASAGYLAASSYTASDVLTKIKTVDGSGSGLDADTVDGIQASSFVRNDTNLSGLVIGDNAGANQNIAIKYGNYDSGYGAIRFYEAGTNTSTIHSFSTSWSNNSFTANSAGAINLDGENGVTFGPWNDVAGWIDDAGTLQTKQSLRAPIFYDSNDTAYYLDPSNGVNSLSIAGNINMQSGKGIWLATSSDTNWQFGRNLINATGENLTSNTIQLKVYGQSVQGFQIVDHTGAARHEFGGTGAAYFQSSASSPIFYDSNNTGYYVDPSNISYVNRMRTAAAGAYDSLAGTAYNSAFRVEQTPTGTTATRWIPMISGTSVSSNGYRQHTVIGSRRGGVWGDCFIGVGGNDNYPTKEFLFSYGGTFTSPGDVVAYSDIKLKENIELIPDALEKVKQLRGVTYTRNDIEDNRRFTGVIAQEVEKVLPEVINYDEVNDIKSVAYGNMVGLLIEAIKKQQETIDVLKIQIEELKSLINK